MTNTSSDSQSFFSNKHVFSFLFLFIVLITCLTRLFQIGETPHGITNDEASYMTSSYSIWETGHDLTGKFLPLSFNLGSSLSPVPIYLSSPFVGVLGLSPVSGRLPFVLASIGTVIVLYFLAVQLLRNKWLALATSFVLAVSPWAIHIGRVAYDGVFALFFFTLGTYLFFRLLEKGSILWSLPAFLMAFYSYHGTKVFFVGFIPLLLIINKDVLWKRKKELALFVVGFVAILISFFVVLKTQHVTRQQEVFLWNDMSIAAKQVDFELQKNTAPFVLRSFVNNKPLYYLRIIKESYLHAFSTDYLFLYGDVTGIYNSYFRGEMYTFEIVFLLIGIYFLWSLKNKKIALFIFGSLLLAPLPSSITQPTNYVVRSIMMLPFLAFIVGAGIYKSFQIATHFPRLWKNLTVFFIVCVYFVFVSSYLYQYFFRYPIYAAENWLGSHRDIVRFINSQQAGYDKVYVSMPNNEFVLQYAVFSKLDPLSIKKLWENSNKTYANITFVTDCLPDESFLNDSYHSLYITRGSCDIKHLPKQSFTDPGEPLRTTWRVFSN